MAKKETAKVKLQLPAGKANPSPPVGPALSQHGVNIMEFCKAFNAATAKEEGMIIPVIITVYSDRSFSFIQKTPPASVLLKKAAGITAGGEPVNTGLTMDGYLRALRKPGGWAGGGSGPNARHWLDFLDKNGIELTVLYPTQGLTHAAIQDKDWAICMAKAYNDWLHNKFMKVSPRLVGVALLLASGARGWFGKKSTLVALTPESAANSTPSTEVATEPAAPPVQNEAANQIRELEQMPGTSSK